MFPKYARERRCEERIGRGGRPRSPWATASTTLLSTGPFLLSFGVPYVSARSTRHTVPLSPVVESACLGLLCEIVGLVKFFLSLFLQRPSLLPVLVPTNSACPERKERKKTDNPREGGMDGAPPPDRVRDFKERCVVLAVTHPNPWASASFYLPSQPLAERRACP